MCGRSKPSTPAHRRVRFPPVTAGPTTNQAYSKFHLDCPVWICAPKWRHDFSTKHLDFSCPFEDFGNCRRNAMHRFSTVANFWADPSRFLLLECMEQIEPDNPKEICCMADETDTARALMQPLGSRQQRTCKPTLHRVKNRKPSRSQGWRFVVKIQYWITQRVKNACFTSKSGASPGKSSQNRGKKRWHTM